MNHLLPGEKDPSELKMACFMGLLSQLAAKLEVLRVSPLHGATAQDFVGSALVQSATTTERPLLDAGLDGTGEVIQARPTNCCGRLDFCRPQTYDARASCVRP